MTARRDPWRKPFISEGRIVEHPPRHHDRAALRALNREIADLVEPFLSDSVHGWRRRRSVYTAVAEIAARPGRRIQADIVSFFGNVDLRRLRRKLDQIAPGLWSRIEFWLPEEGLPTGVHFSPALANLYLSDIDHRFPIVRYADNIMVIAPEPERVLLDLRRHLADIDLVLHPSSIEIDPTHFCKTPLK